MARQYVVVSICCPCGRHYRDMRVDANASSAQRGQSSCPACKRKFEWAVSHGRSFSNYK